MADENEEVVPQVEEEVVPQEETPEIEEEVDWKTEAEKAKGLANNYKIRAEKAETKLKETPAPQQGQLSSVDTVVLAAAVAKGTIDPEDIDRVQKFAADEKLSFKDALANEELKAILNVRVEKRATANAANVSNVRRGPTKMSDETLLDKASKNQLPDDDDGIERLVAAKAKQK